MWQYELPDRLDTKTPDERHRDFIRVTTERNEHLRCLGWTPLSPQQEKELKVEMRSRFPDGVHEPPSPSITWDVSSAYLSASQFEATETNLNLNALLAIRCCTAEGERIYAVDWQHQWYSFDPHILDTDGDPYDWAVPILPDGDSYMFFSSDFRFGIYGFPHTTICVTGQRLIDSFRLHTPKVFHKTIQWSARTFREVR